MTTSPFDFDDDENSLLPPEVEWDDVFQEMKILEWQGKHPKRDLVMRRLASQAGSILLFGSEDLLHAQPMSWAEPTDQTEPTPSQRILEWSQDTPPHVQELIAQFLENPDEDDVPRIIRMLRRRNLVAVSSGPKYLKKQQTTGQTGGSLIALLYKSLQAKPQTLDELYQLTRAVHTAKRPEAACRQALRRLIRQNLVQKTLEGVYRTI